MNQNLIAKASIHIIADTDAVWDALTNPEKIKQYFFGTNAVSDWKVGSPLIFKGEWEGKAYEDKGTIHKSEPGKLFQYDYFSSFSGKEDLPENFQLITYHLTAENGGTRLDITQENIPTEEIKEHSESNWSGIFDSLKNMLENG